MISIGMRRKPAVAGLFYSEDEAELRRQIDASFRHKLGPGGLPAVAKSGARKIRAAIVPHAGYVYSGPIAAHAYAAVAKDGAPNVAIVIGPDHAGGGTMCDYSPEDFETPFGVVPNATDLGARFGGTIVANNPSAHRREHSVEVQLPFLQTLNPALRLLPIVMRMQDEETARELGRIVARIVQDVDEHVLLVASSDLSHVGPQYEQQAPPGVRVDRFAREQDARIIEPIARLDPKGVFDAVVRRGVSACGYGPIAAVLFASQALGSRDVSHLAYATSFDVAMHHSCVGYASFVVS